MAFQTEVHKEQALGQPGDFYDASIRRVTAYKLDTIDSTIPVIGKVFTFDASGEPVLGGTGRFAGILLHPKAYARLGLAPTLALPSESNAELADIGRIIVTTTAAAAPTNAVQYNTTTGDIAGAAPDTPADGMAVIPGATFFMFEAAAGGLAVVQLDMAVQE